MKRKSIILALALCLGLFSLSAQNKSGLSVHFGCVKPGSQFNDVPELVVPGLNTFGSAGGAMTGASFGLKYTYNFKNTVMEKSGLGVFFAADGFWNAMNKDLRNQYDNVSCTKPMYINVPLQIGFNYTTPGRIFNVWAEYSLGADLFMKTQEGWNNNTIKYQMNTEFATQVGFGFMFVKTVSIGAHYYWLGNHDVRAKSESLFNPASTMKTGAWVFKLGFHF